MPRHARSRTAASKTSPTTIISSDTGRAQRLPPNQVETRTWPVLHWGEVPVFDPATWDLTVFPVPFVDAVATFTWLEFQALPRVQVLADMHCVTRWSQLDNLWEGVSTAELRKRVHIAPEAQFVMIHCEHGFTTNMPLADYYKAREKDIPLGRAGKAEEFANLACFLASEQGGYITGTATNVDGGRSPVV